MMSLIKAINSGRERRKQYHGAKAVDYSCCNHGSCPYCRGGRLRYRKLEKVLNKEMQDYLEMELEEN